MRFPNIKLLRVRTLNRGLRHTAKALSYHTSYLARYSTPLKLVNFVAVQVQKWLRTARVRGMPYRYFIDPINICNLHCPVCPTGLGLLGRSPGKIDVQRFKQLVNQIQRYAYIVELYNWGEPFLHPQILELIEYAHRRRVSVRLSSNMNRFTPELARGVVASGLDRLIVSVDGSTQQVYERYRRGGNLERVLANIRALVDEKRRQQSASPFILLRMLVTRQNEDQIGAIRQLADDLGVDGFSTGSFFVDTTDAEQIEEWVPEDGEQSFYDLSADPVNVWHCADLWESMVISWDGGVAPCCWLHQEKNDFDNAFEKPLSEIWNGEAYVSSRLIFARGGTKAGAKKTICSTCRGRPRYLHD